MYKIILLSVFIVNVSAYNVLVAFPYPGKSHSILGEGYVKLLLEAGHDVTYITPFLIKPSHPKLRQIDVSSNIELFPFESTLDIKKIIDGEVDFSDMGMMYSLMHDIANDAVMHPNIQKFMSDSNERFDVAIVEWLYSDVYSG
ncbi:UDP-glycosyltransferase, partial [Manduca sexta]